MKFIYIYIYIFCSAIFSYYARPRYNWIKCGYTEEALPLDLCLSDICYYVSPTREERI